MSVYCVPVESVDAVWLTVENFFSKVLKRHDAEFSLEDLKNFILNGQWKLFAFVNDDEIINGAAVVSFVSYPKSYVAFVTCIGGKTLVNSTYYEEFMKILKSYGVDRVQGYVTDSVARLYKKVGVAKRTNLVEIKL